MDTIEKIREYYNKKSIDLKESVFVAEELVSDVDIKSNPYLLIPRDFKCFASRGKLIWTNIYNRNSESPKLYTMASYNRNWQRIPKTSNSYSESLNIEKPQHYDKLVECVELLSSKFPYFMRFDFYIDAEGPVFGEFTPTSSMGREQSDFGTKIQLQTFFIHPDPMHPIHSEEFIKSSLSHSSSDCPSSEPYQSSGS